MGYELSDSSGTDDDLPPSHQNRFARGGRTAGNGRSAVPGPTPLPRMQNDMEKMIHLIEQEAYCSVLRAFRAQSDAITWVKEGLITELRKELRVSDEEHRELLSRVHADDILLRIREWRKSNGLQAGMIISSQPLQDNVPSPTVSASRKKQKPSQSAAGAPPPALHPSVQPSLSALKRGLPPGHRGKKAKQSMQYPSTEIPGQPQAANRSMAFYPARERAEAGSYDPYIGKRVSTRWPEDNNFYVAVVRKYDPIEGRHALVYDEGTAKEAWEWVNLNEISPEDIKWEDDNPGLSNGGVRSGTGRGFKKSMSRGGSAVGIGRGQRTSKGEPKNDVLLQQNGTGRKSSGDIVLLHTDTLINEVEKIFCASPPDPTEVEKAKKALKVHEQQLLDAITRLEDASDGESGNTIPNSLPLFVV
ncbi:hypothetical protein Dimus_021397 [Dionaea muscipula]